MGDIEREKKVTYRESAEPELLPHLQYQYRNPIEAIQDIIDNSFDARVEGRPLLIYINYEEKAGKLMISDHGGMGMGDEELGKFFKWGLSKKRGQLGRYGWGGKAAMTYLAKSFRILCAKEGDDYATEIYEPHWDDDRSAGYKDIDGMQKPRHPGHGFVQIELEGLKRKIVPEKLFEALGDTYRLAIRERKVTIIFNGKEVPPLKIPTEGERIPFEITLLNDDKVVGWFGLLPKDRALPRGIKPGIKGNVFGRKITDGLFFGHPEPHKEPGTRFLIGEFNIDSEKMPLMTGKNDFDRGSILWEDLTEQMHQLLSSYIEELTETKAMVRLPKGDREAINIAHKIVRLGLVRMGEITYGVRQPRKRKEKREKGEREERGKYIPRTPAPKGAVGERKRLGAGGFVKFICRDLGATVRSAVDEEEGRKKLIICPNYIGYKEARKRGVLDLHIIETAALEIAKPSTGEELSVPEYLERANTYYREFIHAGRKAGLL